MKAIGCLLLSLLLLPLSACTGSEDESPSGRTDLSLSTSSNPVQALAYSYLDQITPGMPQPATGVGRNSLQQRLACFVQELLRSQKRWQQANQYRQWYDENLGHSCAFTSTDQQYTQTTLVWDYDIRLCDRPGEPQGGRCSLTVYQQQDTLHALLDYQRLNWGIQVLSGRHHLQWNILVDDRMQLVNETFYLDSLAN